MLVCEESAETPFTLIIPEDGPPQVSSSRKITPNDPGLCGGLSLDMAAGGSGGDRVLMKVSITNRTDDPWKGTVSLDIEGIGTIPVKIGSVAPGGTGSDELELRLDKGSHELGGALLIGP